MWLPGWEFYVEVFQLKYLEKKIRRGGKLMPGVNVCGVGEPAHILPHGAFTSAPAPGQRPAHRHRTAEKPSLTGKQIAPSVKFSTKPITWKRNSSVWVISSLLPRSGEGNKLHKFPARQKKPHFRGFGENPGPSPQPACRISFRTPSFSLSLPPSHDSGM